MHPDTAEQPLVTICPELQLVQILALVHVRQLYIRYEHEAHCRVGVV